MASAVASLHKKGLLGTPPQFLMNNTMYETITGSESYGVTSNDSDRDVVGFCIPPKNIVFPHLAGEIQGFGRQIQRFEQFQLHHIKELDTGREYDVTIYNIVKFFQLCMENNPNMVDALFTPRRCVLHSTNVAEMVKENRKLFLHKGSWHKFKGYAYAQMSKIRGKQNASNPRRQEWIDKFGYDVKFGYHVVRLINEVEQILEEHDLDLERSREQLKSIRRGEWPLEKLEEHFAQKERLLEELYHKSTLRYEPDEDAIKTLLINCMEEHYGSLRDAVEVPNKADLLVADLRALLNKYE